MGRLMLAANRDGAAGSEANFVVPEAFQWHDMIW
jgi:hypothetical protein